MSKDNQDLAQQIADKVHEAERLIRELHRATKELHGLLEQGANTHGKTLGIDVTPLSAGGDKPR